MKTEKPIVSQSDQASSNEEDIDFAEVIAILWAGKWIVFTTVLSVLIVSFIILKLSPSIYRVDAIVDKPSGFQLQRLQPSKLKGGENWQVGEVKSELVYLRALAQSNSLFVKKMFWEKRSGQIFFSQPIDKALEAEFGVFEGGLDITEPDWANPLKTLSQAALESVNPEQATEILSDYLAFVDKYTINEFVIQLREGYKTALTRLDSEYRSIERLERLKLEDALTRLNEAHDLAESLNIVETPYEQVENVALNILDNRLYILGTKALSEEIKSLQMRQGKPLFAFVPVLRDMQHWREQIQLDLQKLEQGADKSHAFVIVSPPGSSIGPVKPNKPLILLAIMFAAGVLGVVIVFTREGVRAYKARSSDDRS